MPVATASLLRNYLTVVLTAEHKPIKRKPAVRLASKMEIAELLRIWKEDKEDTQNEST